MSRLLAQILGEARRALALAGIMVAGGLALAVGLSAAASASVPRAEGTATPPLASLTGTGAEETGQALTSPLPAPSPAGEAAREGTVASAAMPQTAPEGPAVTPGPTPTVTAGPVDAPGPEDPRATVRAARARQPRHYRPPSLPAGTEEQDRPPASARPGRLPLPVEGAWTVTCGPHCGLHQGVHAYALDLVRRDGATAGAPVWAPVDGEITALAGSTTAYCQGQWVSGAVAGASLVLDFRLPGGEHARLRLVHLDSASIPASLRPAGDPVPVRAGTYLGRLADIGPGCSHLHVALTVMNGSGEAPVPINLQGRFLAY